MQRRSYSTAFKAQIVQECSQPGASVASVALSHGINSNVVHKWLRTARSQVETLPAFIPLALDAPCGRDIPPARTFASRSPIGARP